MSSSSSSSIEVSPSIASAATNLPASSPSPPPPHPPPQASSSPQPHPFSALLTPYSSSPLYPPSPPSPPPPPLSTLRCLLLSSSLPPPPPASYNPHLPQTPYSPSSSSSLHLTNKREENVPRSRAVCWRRTELTKEEWERERKGVERWLRWCEGREIVLVSGGESVRKWVVDGGKEVLSGGTGTLEFEGVERNEKEVRERERKEREQREDQGVLAELREKSAWPKLGKWARGEENYTHLLPLHPPLHSLLTANVKVFTTIESMYSRYVQSFTNGTQTNALKLVWDKSPDAWRFMGGAVQDAWKNAPKNWEVLRKFAESSGADDGKGSS